MTEREPDHLYEELRRKLEDYGSHPAPDVWADLEQHLAAQAAAPARRKRRYWRLAAACLLLLLTASVLWLRPVLTSPTGAVATQGAPKTTSEPAVAPLQTKEAASATDAPPAAVGGPQPPSTAAEASRGATAAVAAGTLPDVAAQPSLAVAEPDNASTAGTAGSTRAPKVRLSTATTVAAASSAESSAQPTRAPQATPSHRRVRQSLAAGRTGTGLGQPGTAAPAAAGSRPPRTSRPTAATPTSRPAETSGASAARLDAPAAPAAASAGGTTESAQLQAAARPTPSNNTRAAQSGNGSITTAGTTAAGAQQSAAPNPTQPESITATAQPVESAATAAARPAAADNRTATAPTTVTALPTAAPELLLGRWALLQLPPAALPTPLTGVPAAAPLPTPALPGRWSVAVLAGPALTYRLLGTATDSLGPGLSRLERPALSYAAQAQLGYAASARLRLSGGLGYQEFATGYNAKINAARVQTVTTRQVQVFDNGTRRDSLVVVHSRDTIVGTEQKQLRQRDTYRYLVVPLQAQLRLGGAGRWSYHGLAGVALGLYLGGRTTEGSSACHCEQVSWPAARSPFRRATALLTLGAAAEYELRPGWHLQLQPVLQQSVLSITDDSRPARRPLGLSVQTGLRFDLP